MATLKPTARKYVREVFAALEPKIAEKTASPTGMPRWQGLDGGTLFVLRQETLSPEEWTLIDELHRVSGLPESGLMDAALRSDSRTARLLGKMVGTPLMSGQMDEESLKRSLLWAVLRAGGVSLRFSEDAFERGYDEWLKATLARTQTSVFLAPVSLQLSEPLDLGDGVELAQMDDDEVSACLTMGAIQLVLPGMTGTAFVGNRAAIRLTFDVPRGPTEDFSDEDQAKAIEAESAAFESAQGVVQALRLFQRGRVSIGGHVLLRGDGSMQGGPYRSPLFPQQDELVLSEPQEFRAFLELFRAALRKNRTMAAVARRFGYAGERPRRDDEIVDLVSSLEGLLLSDIRRGAEYRFRTAIRGALFIDGSGLTAREVKKQLIRGYDVRSAVAHGGTPSESDLKSANGESLTLDEFVEGIEELVRLAVRKAIECVGAGNGWPPDWDALALEGASYPAADA